MRARKNKSVKYYLDLPYTVKVESRTEADGSVVYWASNPEIPHCEIYGATPAEAIGRLRDQRAECIRSLLLNDRPVPLPIALESASG